MAEQKMEFKTEINQLLDLMIHSLYSHKEIFLRELISNASDAIDKACYESLTDSSFLEGEKEWKIRISADKNAGTLTISDNGSGLTREEAVRELGTIAHSGTKEFLKAIQERERKDAVELIGQFGVGFYSAFMVADKVTVLSRKAGANDKKGVRWESAADGTFTVDDVEKETKGTDVILHLKADERKYLEEWEIRNIVKKYSDFIEHPIVMEVEREKESELAKDTKVTVREDVVLNSRKAIWLKDKAEITESEYNEFYRHISHDYADPLRVIHFKAEGTSEFNALLYIPSRAPFNLLYKDYKIGPVLYVRRVQIMDHCEDLLPVYLRFVKGVVDSSDLPLNVSREILQNNRQVEIIKKSVTRKVLDTLSEMKSKEYDTYVSFYKEFGRVLKEGIHFDFSRREAIADLLLFPSTKTEQDAFTTLQKYVEGMGEEQKEIYYITGTSLDEVMKSPYLEAFHEKGLEVLILLDDLDDFVMGDLAEYKEKKFKSVIKGDIDLGKSVEERKETKQRFEKLIELFKNQLKDEVKDVRLSGRLKDSPCCLVADEGDVDPTVEKLLKSMGREVFSGKRILEINPDHPVLAAMEEIFEKDRESPLLKEYIDILYNQAVLLEGSKPKDPGAFARSITNLMVKHAVKG
ncbi:MAG: molecular chaperone HtpG [Alphaproteobacteria bacterium]|uniref:Chaperone protein HtpG n=1 Tax=Candidatus Nitrobium versatile TaxID=2884831 RepID=A0A953M119_9BACT|nr:molecular chaperone HtpG [Candidatus Nitrobium versatile]